MRGGSDFCGCFPTGRSYPGIAHLVHSTFQGVAQGFDPSSSWIDQPVVMIDTETTGREANEDRIIEIAIVRGRSGSVLSRDSWLINPERPIPVASSGVHGIYDKDVRGKPTFADVFPEIIRCLAQAIPAAYNASFDRGFLFAEARRAGRSPVTDAPAVQDRVVWIDPLVWARLLYPGEKSRKLSSMASLLGIALEHAHRATADAEAALLVMYKMAEDGRIPTEYGRLIQEQVSTGRLQEEARSMWRRR